MQQQQNSTNAAGSGPMGGPAAGLPHKPVQGGRFDFDDGGMYCGGWEDGKAHGHGVCTGLKGQGEYCGSWNYGFEVSGVYTWPGGSTYEGHWQNGKRHGLGVETRGRWIYRGEWTQGFKGRYGVRQSLTSTAKYDGTWANGLQDGYGSESYADGGTYQGQWLRGLRHGYGVRTSAPFGMASRFRPKTNIRSSMTSLRSEGHAAGAGADPAADRDRRLDDGRGGFVLKARSDEPPVRRRSFSERSSTIKKTFFQGLRLKKQHSTGELEKRGTRGTSASIRSTASTASWMSTESSQSGMTAGSQHTDSNASFVAEDEPLDASVTETYMGEWKNDKRSGFGVSERSDGLKYEGEWFNNKKYGYGVTTFKDGTKEEGKYKNNVLITSQKKKHLFLIRSAKFRERIEAAVSAAQRASKIALQKADIAISRTSTARAKAEQADLAAIHAREDADFAIAIAKQLAPDFTPSSETMRPPLAALSRLVPQLSVAAAAAASGSGQQTASKFGQTPNNVSHANDYSGGDTSASASPQPRIDDMLYEKSLSPDSAASTLNRRPSVAIGGVRGPTSKNEQEHLTSLSNATYPMSNNRSQMPAYNSNQMGNSMMGNSLMANSMTGNSMMGNNTMERKNSLDQFGRSMSQSSHHPYQQQQSYQQQQQQPYQQQQHQYQQQQNQYQQPQQQQQQQGYRQQSFDGGMYSSSGDEMAHGHLERGRSSLRRGPMIRQMSATSPGWSGGGGQGPGPGYSQQQHQQQQQQPEVTSPSYSFQQAMNDHFDHYKRPPSRDRSRDPSMDRFSRSSRQSSVAHIGRHDSSLMGSRAPSRGPSPAPTPGMSAFRSTSRQRPSLVSNSPTPSGSRFYPEANDSFSAGSNSNANTLQRRMATPMREMSTGPGNGSVASGFAGIGVGGIGGPQPSNAVEEMLLRQRLGQEIPHTGNTPKRTESLYLSPARKKETVAPAPVPKRKKSLPGSKDAPVPILSREEASVLSSQRREEIRRQNEEAERMRANPLLYFCSPQVKAWFARQQLTIFILIFNFSLAFLFFKLLT